MRQQTLTLLKEAWRKCDFMGWIPSRVAVQLLECERSEPFATPQSAPFYQWRRNKLTWVRRSHCPKCGVPILEVHLAELREYLKTYKVKGGK